MSDCNQDCPCPSIRIWTNQDSSSFWLCKSMRGYPSGKEKLGPYGQCFHNHISFAGPEIIAIATTFSAKANLQLGQWDMNFKSTFVMKECWAIQSRLLWIFPGAAIYQWILQVFYTSGILAARGQYKRFWAAQVNHWGRWRPQAPELAWLRCQDRATRGSGMSCKRLPVLSREQRTPIPSSSSTDFLEKLSLMARLWSSKRICSWKRKRNPDHWFNLELKNTDFSAEKMSCRYMISSFSWYEIQRTRRWQSTTGIRAVKSRLPSFRRRILLRNLGANTSRIMFKNGRISTRTSCGSFMDPSIWWVPQTACQQL